MNIGQARMMTEAIQQQRRNEYEKDLKQAEWQWDEQAHRHYRMLGKNAKEYAPTITVNGIEIENIGDNLKQAHEAMKQQKEKQTTYTQQKKSLCPFNSAATLGAECSPECALYGPAGCRLKKDAQGETKGRRCPFLRECSELCAMYNHGCTL